MEMDVSYEISICLRQILSNLAQRHHHTRSHLLDEYEKPYIKLPFVYAHETIYVCCHVRVGSHVNICLKAFSAQLGTKFNPDA
jgi:hypothetical protein